MKYVIFIGVYFVLLFSKAGELPKDKKFIAKYQVAKAYYTGHFYKDAALAYNELMTAYPVTKTNGAFLNEAAESNYKVRNYDKAASLYQVLTDLQVDESTLSEFWLAKSQLALNSAGYLATFELFVAHHRNDEDEMVKKYVALADKQITFLKNQKRDESNLPTFKKLLPSDYNASVSPFYVSDSIIYYSASEPFKLVQKSEVNGVKIKVTQDKAFDMYSAFLEDGELFQKELLEVEGLSKDDEYTAGDISKDGERLYFTGCNLQKCKIYTADWNGASWGTPQVLSEGINAKNSSSITPSLVVTENGDEVLFFSSDRNRAKSGWDIYYAVANENHVFSEAKPLSGQINTILDESAPYYDVYSHALFFSSDGQPGYGARDVFSVELKGLKPISPVVNIGATFNSNTDEFQYRLSRDGKSGLLVSDRYNDHHINQVVSFKYQETFDFKKLAQQENNQDFTIIEDDDGTWIYINIEGKQLDGETNDGGTEVYLISSSGELIDVSKVENNKFHFDKTPLNEKFKISTNGNGEQPIMVALVNPKETVAPDMVSIPTTHQALDSFNYNGELKENKINKSIDDEMVYIHSAYGDQNKFYLLNLKGAYIGYSTSSSKKQIAETAVFPFKLLFEQKLKKINEVSFLNENGDTLFVIAEDINPEYFLYKNGLETLENINTSLSENGRPVFQAGIVDYSVEGKTNNGKKVFLINHKENTIDSTESSNKGVFNFRKLDSGTKYSLGMEERDYSQFKELAFYDSENKLVKSLDENNNPRFFQYKKLSQEEKDFLLANSLTDESQFLLVSNRLSKSEEIKEVTGVVITEENGKYYIESLEEEVTLKGYAPKGSQASVINVDEELIATVDVDEDETFFFRKLPKGQKMRFEIASEDESSFKGFSIINKEGKEFAIDSDDNVFDYKKLEQGSGNSKGVANVDNSEYVFSGETTLLDAVLKRKVDTDSANTQVKVIEQEKQAVGAEGRANIQYMKTVNLFCSTKHNNKLYTDFVTEFGAKEYKDVHYRVQILSFNQNPEGLQYDLVNLKNKGVNSVIKSDEAVYWDKEYSTVNDAEIKRKEIYELFQGRIKPLIVMYVNNRRTYSLILHE